MMLNRITAPEQHPIGTAHIMPPEQVACDNGLDMFIFHAAEQDLVRLDFVFQNLFDERENSLINSTLCAMLREGTSEYTSAEIAETIDFHGGYLLTEYGMDHTTVSLYILNKHIHRVLPLIFSVLTDSNFPQKELETYIRNSKQAYQVSMEKNDIVARKIFFSKVFGENRYGRSPSLEDFDRIDRVELQVLFEAQITPSNCTLFLAGNITPDLLLEIEKKFGREWLPATILSPYLGGIPKMISSAPAGLVYEEKVDSLQSAIRLGGLTISREHPDFPSLQFVNSLFGGYFGSRLMRNIREEKGFTYGISSAIGSLKHAGMFTIGTEVGIAFTQKTLDEINYEMTVLRKELATDSEVELVRNYILGALLGSLESVFSHADKFKTVYFAGLDLEYYQYYTEEIQKMNAIRVRDLANKYMDFENLIQVVVGKNA